MCAVLKLEIDGVPIGTGMESVEIPLKINTLEITPETEVAPAATAIGLTQPEVNALATLVREYPRALTDGEKQLLLVRNCMVLGQRGVIDSVTLPPQLTRERRLSWEEVMPLGYLPRLSHWYSNLKQVQSTEDKIRCIVRPPPPRARNT